MNRQAILNLLFAALSLFDIHPKLSDEIIRIIVGSGYETRFFKLLGVRLEYLSRYGVDATNHEEFELLRNGVFSMHLSSRGFNIRILYAFLPDRTPTLLACFHERAGKRRTDYSDYINLAISRLKERMEAFESEQSEG